MIPEHLKYVATHEWLDPKTGKMGITDPAQEQLGDMVFVEFPEVGSEFAQGERFGSVESVKSVSDCYLPVSGKVLAINEDLLEAPEVLNQDPYEKGWLIRIEIKSPAEVNELMSAADYDKFVKEEAGEH